MHDRATVREEAAGTRSRVHSAPLCTYTFISWGGVALHAFYAAVATFKIARCTTRKAQIYFLLPRGPGDSFVGYAARRYTLPQTVQASQFPRPG